MEDQVRSIQVDAILGPVRSDKVTCLPYPTAAWTVQDNVAESARGIFHLTLPCQGEIMVPTVFSRI